jgi:tetratricopeptide (TPR) repeat protein
MDRDAVVKYSDELILVQDSVDNRLLQIQTYLKVGLISDAGPKLQSFKEKYSADARALLLEAWLAMRQGRLEQALNLTNRSLGENENALAWQLRGRINYLLGRHQQAIDDLKTSKALQPSPTSRFLLARVYLGAGLTEDALTELKNTVDLPEAPIGTRKLMEQIYRDSGNTEALDRFYRETLGKLGDSIEWHNRAAAFAVTRGDIEEAEQLYRKAMQIAAERQGNPAGKTVNISDYRASLDGYLQTLLLAADSPSGTVTDTAKLNALFEVGGKLVDGTKPDVSAVAYLRMAEAKTKLGDKTGAIQYYRKSLDKVFQGQDRAFAREMLQRVRSAIGNDSAMDYCNDALKAGPNAVSANLAMFFMLNFEGQYNESLQYIDKCLAVSGSDREERLYFASRKARTLEDAYYRRPDKSYLRRIVSEYESLLSEMPNNMVVFNNLAYVLSLSDERLDDAMDYAGRALGAMPDNPSFLDTYGYVLYKNGKYKEADEYLQAALQQYMQSRISAPSDVHEHLGMVREALGQKAEALKAYEEALSVGRDTLAEAVRKRIEESIQRVNSAQ